MSTTLCSASSLSHGSLTSDASRILPALWALRFAINHENGPAHISDPRSANTAWLTLVGDCVQWPNDLLNDFFQICAEDIEGDSVRRSRRKKNRSSLRWPMVFTNFAQAYAKQPERIIQHFQKSIENLEAHWKSIRDQDTVWKNITLLGDLVRLSELERKLLLYLVCFGYSRPFRDFFCELEFISLAKAAEILASMFNCTAVEIMDALHNKHLLMTNGLIAKGRNYPDWSDFIELSASVKTALTCPNKDLNELMQHFTDKATPGHLTYNDIPHLESSLHWMTKIMSNALLNQERGINILLYGAPGTGKTEFAKLLAEQVGAILYEVSYKDDEGEAACDRERYVSLVMAQKFLAARNDTLLLFDEVEDVLEGSGSSMSMVFFGVNQNRNRFNKAWINQQLENNPVPTIWICNEHRLIDPSHLRRFLVHLEFRVPPRSVRQRVAERYFKNVNLPDSALENLSLNSSLTPAQLENTARLLKLSGCDDPVELEKLLENSIRQNMMVMGLSADKPHVKSITPYRLTYLNADSQVPISRLVGAMQKRPRASLCFYGPPGTGKTQLAEYLAEQLDQNLIVKRGSDLLSKWLGESEQNIAAMFKEARDENAILFLDEADSLLRDRQGMTKSWEVSQVNELLQQMERFEGVFICATNLFDQLDQAALRRFAFKIRFDFLKPSQRIALFADILHLNSSSLSQDQECRLHRLDSLTPGDFATVLRQADTLGETPSAGDFLCQLESECAFKNGGRLQRGIGFI